MVVKSPEFWGGSDLANFFVQSEFLQRSWGCVTAGSSPADSVISDPPVSIHMFQESGQGNKYRVIGFRVSCSVTDYLWRVGDLVSSSTVTEFQFLCSKAEPCFSINKAAVSLFRSIIDELSHLRDELAVSTATVPCVITGSGLGGSVASLFTLWLLGKLDLATAKWPLCITFGAPLLGDAAFQNAISQYSMWNSCFFHVVHKDDPIPKAYLNSPAARPVSETGPYTPFGTYMWCSGSGSAGFVSSKSVIELLAMSSKPGQNMELQSYDYGATITKLKAQSIYKDPFNVLGENMEFRAGISIGIAAIGLWNSRQGGQQDYKVALERIESAEANYIKQQPSVFDQAKRLNDVKVDLANMEWYKKVSEANGGYYDCYKNKATIRDHQAVWFKRKLTDYWEKFLEEVEKKPQREGAHIRTRWLFGGTNYRRLVEPLEIAEYYHSGKEQYLNGGRPLHYEQLEQMLVNDTSRRAHDSHRSVRGQNIATVVMLDSCFWAHVEEAIRACNSVGVARVLNRGEVETIKGFEEYVMSLVNEYSLSPDVFHEGSSFMQWWRQYDLMLEEHMIGFCYTSPLIEFMRSGSYSGYVNGTYGLSNS